ncbi:MAG: cytochrome c3 family protein [Deltaproteobacteria bacterium]|nr:cytochrome c3 family protein [Deltaproteobacteria bacterium]
MRAGALLAAFLITASLIACEPPRREPEVVVTVRSASELVPLPSVEASALGEGARALGPHRFVVSRRSLARSLTLEGFCTEEISRPEGPALDVVLRPRVEVLAPAPVGFDAPFTIEVRPGCREAIAGHATWEIVRAPGGEVGTVGLTTERRGFVVHGRTAAWTPPVLPRWGLVPISAAEAGEIVLRMRFVEGESAPITREVRVLAAARSTGLPSIAIGAAALLRGGPFVLRESPPGAHAVIEQASDGLERFVPDVEGRWLFADREGRTLALRSGEHARTPLDCGRSECHARETEHAAASPMTRAFVGREREACAIACHTVGEPGLPDGGFVHEAGRLGWSASTDGTLTHATLPRSLRRLAGVGCTACHGPGAIPEASARWAILRTDVCASCHDAPPRYGHVAAWSRSAMSQSDHASETREAPCARCHTTAGFLESIGARAHTDVPAEAGPLGIACAACHAPHAEARLEVALVRRVPVPASLGALPDTWTDRGATVCLTCHAPGEEGATASSAAILLGVGGRTIEGGLSNAVEDEAPHREITCTECHASEPSNTLERGAAHAFAIDRDRCVRCHDRALVDRAFAQADVLGSAARARLADDGSAPHPTAHPDDATRWNAALVRGDPGAWAHAPAYARRLLGASSE